MSVRLKEEEGISVTPQAIWYRLRESRWSWKTGRPTNPEGDKEAQEAFKKGRCQKPQKMASELSLQIPCVMD